MPTRPLRPNFGIVLATVKRLLRSYDRENKTTLIREYFQSLDDDEQEILRLRYGLSWNKAGRFRRSRPLSLEDAAFKLDLSRLDARCLESRAMSRLPMLAVEILRSLIKQKKSSR